MISLIILSHVKRSFLLRQLRSLALQFDDIQLADMQILILMSGGVDPAVHDGVQKMQANGLDINLIQFSVEEPVFDKVLVGLHVADYDFVCISADDDFVSIKNLFASLSAYRYKCDLIIQKANTGYEVGNSICCKGEPIFFESSRISLDINKDLESRLKDWFLPYQFQLFYSVYSKDLAVRVFTELPKSPGVLINEVSLAILTLGFSQKSIIADSSWTWKMKAKSKSPNPYSTLEFSHKLKMDPRLVENLSSRLTFGDGNSQSDSLIGLLNLIFESYIASYRTAQGADINNETTGVQVLRQFRQLGKTYFVLRLIRELVYIRRFRVDGFKRDRSIFARQIKNILSHE